MSKVANGERIIHTIMNMARQGNLLTMQLISLSIKGYLLSQLCIISILGKLIFYL